MARLQNACPKPKRRRAAPKKVQRRNRKRWAKNHARAYGPAARRDWIKAQPCLVCVMLHPIFTLTVGPSENAHTVGGGGSRKADAATIVPMCHTHHRWYDERQNFLAIPSIRARIQGQAIVYERRWQSTQVAREQA